MEELRQLLSIKRAAVNEALDGLQPGGSFQVRVWDTVKPADKPGLSRWFTVTYEAVMALDAIRGRDSWPEPGVLAATVPELHELFTTAVRFACGPTGQLERVFDFGYMKEFFTRHAYKTLVLSACRYDVKYEGRTIALMEGQDGACTPPCSPAHLCSHDGTPSAHGA